MRSYQYLTGLTVVTALALCSAGCNPRIDAIRVSTPMLNIGLTEAPQTFEVWNASRTAPTVELRVIASEAWVIPDRRTLSCPPPDAAGGPYIKRRVTVTIDRDRLAQGDHTAEIELRGEGVFSKVVKLEVRQQSSPEERDELNIVNPKYTFSAPYLLDFSFSLEDKEGNAVSAEPAQFDVQAFEGPRAISVESGVHIKRASARQLFIDLVLDYTYSMQVTPGAIAGMESAAKDTLLPALNTDAMVGVVEFHREDREAQRVASFSEDRQYVRRRIDAIQDEYVGGYYGGSAIWDSLMVSLDSFDAYNPLYQARYIVLFTDGDDNGTSLARPDEVVEVALERDVHIFTIGFGDAVNEAELAYVADETDGAYIPANSVDSLETAFGSIADQLGGQYNLRWASLVRDDDQAFRPAFTLSIAGNEASYMAEDDFIPSENVGDVAQGELALVPSDTESSTVVYLRALYVPRSIDELHIFFESEFPFTVGAVEAADEGLLAGDWNVDPNPVPELGGVWVDITARTPGTYLPFAVFGPMLKLDFGHLEDDSTPLFTSVYVDNTVYPEVEGQSFVVRGFEGSRPPGE